MLLTAESEYFEDNVDGGLSDTGDHILRLKDVERETCKSTTRNYAQRQKADQIAVDLFLRWIYTEEVPDIAAGGTKQIRAWETSIVKAYAFGHKIQAIGFKGALLQSLVEYFVSPGNGGVPLFETITIAFAHLPKDDVLCRLLVDVHCRGYDPDHDDGRELKDRKNLPHEFLLQVMIRYRMACNCIFEKELDVDDYEIGESSDGEEGSGAVEKSN